MEELFIETWHLGTRRKFSLRWVNSSIFGRWRKGSYLYCAKEMRNAVNGHRSKNVMNPSQDVYFHQRFDVYLNLIKFKNKKRKHRNKYLTRRLLLCFWKWGIVFGFSKCIKSSAQQMLTEKSRCPKIPCTKCQVVHYQAIRRKVTKWSFLAFAQWSPSKVEEIYFR